MNNTHDGNNSTNTPVRWAGNSKNKYIDLTGMVFGKIKVIDRSFEKRGSSRSMMWNCACECGKKKVMSTNSLRSSGSRSCGCSKQFKAGDIRQAGRTHGMSGTWQCDTLRGIIQRCTDKNCEAYKDYGGRGITFDPRWKSDPSVFFKELESLGPRPEDGSIDRIDCNGNYELSNIRWASRKEQALNRRSNIKLTFNGKTQCMKEWAEEIGVSNGTLWWRITKKGWSVERALTQGVRKTAPFSEWNRKPSLNTHEAEFVE